MGRTCGAPNTTELTPIGMELNGSLAKVPDKEKMSLWVSSVRQTSISTNVAVTMERSWYPMRYVEPLSGEPVAEDPLLYTTPKGHVK